MESVIAEFEGKGCDTGVDCPLTTAGMAVEPKAAAVMIPLAFRKDLRLLFDGTLEGLEDLDFFMTPPNYFDSSTVSLIALQIHG
jgi:hypothetical protein